MKKSRELALMLEAFERKGFCVPPLMAAAMEEGLRSIRREKFEERARAQQKKARRRQGNADSGFQEECMDGAITTAQLASYGPTAEKLGDPAGHKIADYAVTADMLPDQQKHISDTEQRSLESRFPVFQDPERYIEERRIP